MSEPNIAAASPSPVGVRHFILGTAGHIDHGKTSLVRALTGVNTDRLPEEQRRGMTIELGFASLSIGDCQFGIVDVPGHERFVRTMVAGATGIDIALLVVAADDSVMPQTREHVEILNLLGLTRGVVAVTKCDLVDAAMLELVVDDVQRLLAPTPLKDAPICSVSSVTGAGLAELREAIVRVAADVVQRSTAGPFRMAIDRVFTVAGRGTVVTGSVLSGSAAEGDGLIIHPGGESCRVRGLQSHGEHAVLVARGQRAAINLSGVTRESLARGMELATPGFLTPARMLDVKLTCLPSYGRPLKSASTVRLEIGTMELPARLVLLSARHLTPGASDYAQLRCGQALTAVYGQRFIVRDENAQQTIGGGVVLRPLAPRRRRSVEAEQESLLRLEAGDAPTRVEEVLRQVRFAAPSELTIVARSGVVPGEVGDILELLRQSGRWVPIGSSGTYAVPAAVAELGERLTNWLARFHRAHPELPGRSLDAVSGWLERMTNRALAKPLVEQLEKGGAFKRLGSFACAPAFAPVLSSADEKFLSVMIEEIRSGGFQPPALAELSFAGRVDRKRLERLATLAAALGEIVPVDGSIFLQAEVERQLREKVALLIKERGQVTVADVREALGSSRKFVVPFLEYLDRVGVTRREGDVRVRGSRDGGTKNRDCGIEESRDRAQEG